MSDKPETPDVKAAAQPTPPTEPYVKEFLSPDEARQLLGVGRSAIYAAIAGGTLPYVRVGRLIRIPRASLTHPEAPSAARKRRGHAA